MKRIVGLLGWLGVVLVVAAVVLRFAKPELQQWYQGLAIAGLVVTLLYTLTQWRDIARSFGGRNIRYGSVAAGSVVLLLGLLIAVNYISNRQNKRWDLTQSRQFSLSDQTKKIVSSLKKPVAVKVFYQAGGSMLATYRDRLEEYAHQSSQFTVEYIDAEKSPSQAKQYQIQNFGTVIFEYDGRTERATSSQEQDLTNALIKAVEGKTKKVYFVQGHGERSTTGSDREGYSQIATKLKNDNFDVAVVALAQEGKVPDDASVVVIAGPKTDYLAQELDLLRAYLKKGGKLVLLIDPPDRLDSPALTNLIAFAKEWGVTVGNDVVLDASGMGQVFGTGPEVPIAMSYPSHPITERFGNVMTAYRLARSVTPIEGGTDGHIAQKIAETSARSWAESDVKSLLTTHQASPDPTKGDKMGPIPLVAAVSAAATGAPAGGAPDAPKPETRVVVAGDSDFAGNYLVVFQGNADFFMNIVNWVAQQENLIAIHPVDPADRRITLTEDQSKLIFWLTFAIIPGLLFATGVMTWWRRR
jgi:ABC-type uncharacterized transport system involved in gliding motility auxiliary subunit